LHYYNLRHAYLVIIIWHYKNEYMKNYIYYLSLILEDKFLPVVTVTFVHCFKHLYNIVNINKCKI